MGHVSAPNGRLQDAASVFASHGLSVIPIGSLADKAPGLESWKPYTRKAASKTEARHWFISNGRPAAPGLGLVCGAVSGGLTVIDFDTLADGDTLYDPWAALVEQLSPGLLDTLPLVGTPSGGWHVYFRCPVVEGNTKLAESASRQTWIETRGEGGYVLAPPTPAYHVYNGRISDTPTISPAQRDVLLYAARSLTGKQPTAPRQADNPNPLPGVAYNARATVATLCDLLTRHDWTVVHQDADAATVRRPGKDRGISATIRTCDGVPVTYTFSSNAAPLEAGVGLSPFAVYATLEHGGDFSAAARALLRTSPPSPNANTAVRVVPLTPAPFDWRSHLVNGNDLLNKEFPPQQWVVPGVFPSGLTLVAGSPKSGKSLMGLNVGCAVATGGIAFGNVPVQQRPVLYMALEDGQRLLQKRMRRLLSEGADAGNINFAEGWLKLTEGGTAMIGEYCAEHPDALVVIDTYESLRGNGNEAHDSYRNDYAALKPLADLVHAQALNVLIIHHTNKRGGEDPFNSINGSNGIAGVCDTLGILRRRNDSDEVVLHLRGRDLDSDMNLALEFDPATGCHTLLGDSRDVGKNRDQQAIVAFLRQQGVQSSPREIAMGTGRANDKGLLMQLGRMVEAGTLIKTDWGRYALPDDEEKVTKVTHGVQAASRDCQAPAEDDRGCVTSVTSVTSEPEASPPVDANGAFNGVPAATQTLPCPGCGKKWTKKPAPGDGGDAWCIRCGASVPMA